MRITISGTSGSGKSTLAKRLAASIDLPHIELDAVNRQPEWRSPESEDPVAFRRGVEAVATLELWVINGNYRSALGPVLARTTHIIWLDYPRMVVMWRVIMRSLLRAATKAELWPGTGNIERFSQWIEKDSPIRRAWATHAGRRREFARLFESSALSGIQTFRVRNFGDRAAVESELLRQAHSKESLTCSR